MFVYVCLSLCSLASVFSLTVSMTTYRGTETQLLKVNTLYSQALSGMLWVNVLSTEDQLLLKKAEFGTPTSLRFAAHMRIGPISQVRDSIETLSDSLVVQVSIFQLVLMESQLLLQPINTYRCPQVQCAVHVHTIRTMYILHVSVLTVCCLPCPELCIGRLSREQHRVVGYVAVSQCRGEGGVRAQTGCLWAVSTNPNKCVGQFSHVVSVVTYPLIGGTSPWRDHPLIRSLYCLRATQRWVQLFRTCCSILVILSCNCLFAYKYRRCTWSVCSILVDSALPQFARLLKYAI